MILKKLNNHQLGLLLLCLCYSMLAACQQPQERSVNEEAKTSDWNAKATEVATDLSQKAEALGQEIGKSSEEIAEAVSVKIKDALKNSSETLPAQEIKKLRQFEYKVFDMPSTTSNEDLEIALNKLGVDRWECSAPRITVQKESTQTFFKFFCKRRPFTPLRYVPRTF